MDDIPPDQLEDARRRGEALMRGPRAESVRYDAGRNRVTVRLTTGIEVSFAPRDAQGLEGAGRNDLEQVEVDALGLAIRFPTLDADLYVPALLDGRLGSAAWMEARARKLAMPRAKAG